MIFFWYHSKNLIKTGGAGGPGGSGSPLVPKESLMRKWSLWENEATSYLIYYLSEQFLKAFLVSITSFKCGLIKFDVHFVNDFPNKSKINRVSVRCLPEPPNTSRSLVVPKKKKPRWCGSWGRNQGFKAVFHKRMGDVLVGLTQDHTRRWGENTNGQLLSLIGAGPDLHLKETFLSLCNYCQGRRRRGSGLSHLGSINGG